MIFGKVKQITTSYKYMHEEFASNFNHFKTYFDVVVTRFSVFSKYNRGEIILYTNSEIKQRAV